METRCRITSGGGNSRDSATENRPPPSARHGGFNQRLHGAARRKSAAFPYASLTPDPSDGEGALRPAPTLRSLTPPEAHVNPSHPVHGAEEHAGRSQPPTRRCVHPYR